MRTSSTLAFACYTAACRPPTSGGTGGSSKSKGKAEAHTHDIQARHHDVYASTHPTASKRSLHREAAKAHRSAAAKFRAGLDGHDASVKAWNKSNASRKHVVPPERLGNF